MKTFKLFSIMVILLLSRMTTQAQCDTYEMDTDNNIQYCEQVASIEFDYYHQSPLDVHEEKQANNDYKWAHSFSRETRDGIEFGVWKVPNDTYTNSETGYGVYVINLTKEKLEIELLKKQLKE